MGEAKGVMDGLGTTYSGNYTTLPWEWRLSAELVAGEPVIVHLKRIGAAGEWQAHSAFRLWNAGLVVHIRDYIHVDYLWRDGVSPHLRMRDVWPVRGCPRS